MTTRERVRVKTGAPVASDFDSPLGTPVVIDDTAGSGGIYYLDSSGAVVGIVGLGSSPAFSGVVTASRFVSTIATGTSPYSCTSTTLNTNLNADLVDGLHAASFQLASGYTAADVLSKLLTVDGSGSGLDADLLDGFNSASSSTASTVARRDASGYLFAQGFNSSWGDESSAASHYLYMTGSDGYYLRKTLANVKTEIVTNAAITTAIGNTGGIASLSATLANNATSTVTGSGDVACGLLILRHVDTGGVALVTVDPGILAIVTVSDPSSVIGAAAWEVTTSGNNVVITNKWGGSRSHKSTFISTGGSITFA